MRRNSILNLSAAAALGFALLSGGATAQQKSLKDRLVGTWILVQELDVQPDGKTSEPWGANPKGTYMFDTGGHFVQMLMRSDLPKYEHRTQGTPEQNKAVVQGSIAIYGTYSVSEPDKVVNLHFKGSTFAIYDGTDGKRIISSLTEDELKLVNPGTATGRKTDSIWRRAK